jgi:purine-binding chemotaxis protein CheW
MNKLMMQSAAGESAGFAPSDIANAAAEAGDEEDGSRSRPVFDDLEAAEKARRVMDERALALAQTPHRTPIAAEVIEVAIFVVSGETYAIETRYIRKIVRPADLAFSPASGERAIDVITPVPGAPEVLAGVINFRGEILAVFDLAIFLGLTAREIGEKSRIIVLGDERDDLGLLVDETRRTTTLRIDELIEPPATVGEATRSCIRGVTTDALIVLDGSALPRDRRLLVDQAEAPGL